jgi:hypothetical protein
MHPYSAGRISTLNSTSLSAGFQAAALRTTAFFLSLDDHVASLGLLLAANCQETASGTASASSVGTALATAYADAAAKVRIVVGLRPLLTPGSPNLLTGDEQGCKLVIVQWTSARSS